MVDEAAGALRDLARQNTPQFQGKLRQLKSKRGWSDDQFLRRRSRWCATRRLPASTRSRRSFCCASPAAARSGAADSAPDCKLLAELRAVMGSLVETQKAKWAYMFEKIEAELRK